MRRDIVVYSYPYTDENTFTLAYLNDKRDAVLSRVVSASVDGSYMGTEYKVMPPQLRNITVQEDEMRQKCADSGRLSMAKPWVAHTSVTPVWIK